MKLDCFEEVKRLTSEMVAIPSINKEPHGETAVARYVYNYFMDLPYFKAHPEQVICFQTKDDFVERHYRCRKCKNKNKIYGKKR